uniref:Uncharacterized protein n=1 Tax=Anguilla anguilla TaxID=7936 RepID=A0A0E9VDP8_ANGAN
MSRYFYSETLNFRTICSGYKYTIIISASGLSKQHEFCLLALRTSLNLTEGH